MQHMSSWRTEVAAGVGVLAVAAIALVASLSFSGTSPQPVEAVSTVEPGLDFSISSTSLGQDCDSSGMPAATCTFPLNSTFTMDFNLNPPLPANLVGHWTAYDMLVGVENVTAHPESLGQQGSGVWDGCVIAVHDFSNPDEVGAGCSIGIGSSGSAYTGVLLHLDFQCGSVDGIGTLTLLPVPPGEASGTALSDDTFQTHTEANAESLTIICGSPPTHTPTPTTTPTATPGSPGGTPTPTSLETPTATSTPADLTPVGTPQPTNTAPPPTATRTPTRTPLPAPHPGDVNGDSRVDTLDALWVLWFDSGMVPGVAHPENADLTHDGLIDARDAAVILQVKAGLITI